LVFVVVAIVQFPSCDAHHPDLAHQQENGVWWISMSRLIVSSATISAISQAR
jgi:hypothetical protein